MSVGAENKRGSRIGSPSFGRHEDPEFATPGQGPNSPSKVSSCTTHFALPPPLPFLPTEIDLGEVQMYRMDYQAFRGGHASGAVGELSGLACRPIFVDCGRSSTVQSDGPASWKETSEAGAEELESDDEAYYSAPERFMASSPFKRSSTDYVGDSVEPSGRSSPKRSIGQEGFLTRSEKRPEPSLPLGSPRFIAVVDGMPWGDSPFGAEHKEAADTARPRCDSGSFAPPAELDFMSWLHDEVRCRPDAAQLNRVPRSHLLEVLKVGPRLEKVLLLGLMFCFDILLHELSFMPFQAAKAVVKSLIGRTPSVTEQCDLLRLVMLLFNFALISAYFDPSEVYHYIRGESFLKIYVMFNMLEMFERWLRSVGVDLFDLVMASIREPWARLVPRFLATLVCCFCHSLMHFLRVLLLSVAISTDQSVILIIVVTNNFGEIKSTVFKRYEAKSLFPIITSDIVERFYLVWDIIFVLQRLGLTANRGALTPCVDVITYASCLLAIEVLTDWIKFCLIFKFSELKASMLDEYREVLWAGVLECRSRHFEWAPHLGNNKAPDLPMRGILPFSHMPARRIGFSGVPMTTLVLSHLTLFLATPCRVVLSYPYVWAASFLLVVFAFCALAKILLGIILLGSAASRRGTISAGGLELFSKIKAL